jgi:predicted glycosyltransferase
MKILVDVHHPVDINFFKNAIRILTTKHDCHVEIAVQPRGRIVPILQRELPDYHSVRIGTHRKSFAGKVYDAGVRFLGFVSYLRRGGFDVAVGFGGISLCHATYVLGKPSVIFDDDPEFGIGFYPYKPFATRLVMPQHIPVHGKNVVSYRGFKELAYVHPNHFKPDEGALQEYGLSPGSYVFVREVSNISMNYTHLEEGQLADVCRRLRTLGLNVVLSLEDKSLTDRFAPHCIILQEPVRDIYSLMHFALLAISSGDTMARESCLTGTPVIYTGGRFMSVNSELIRKGIFFEPDTDHTVMELVDMIIEQNIKEKTREIMQQALSSCEWEDTTEVIVNNVLQVMQKNRPSRT